MRIDGPRWRISRVRGEGGQATRYHICVYLIYAYRQLHLYVDTYSISMRGGSLYTLYVPVCFTRQKHWSLHLHTISYNYAPVQSFIRGIRSDAKHRIRKQAAPEEDTTTHFSHDRYQICIFHAHLSFQPLVVVFLAGKDQISNVQWHATILAGSLITGVFEQIPYDSTKHFLQY